MPTYEYKCETCGTIEIFHSILEEPRKICPDCGKSGLERLISAGGGFIMRGKQANQYNDIKAAKYWRDADGNKWPVTPGDGHSNAPTVSKKRKRSPGQVDRIVKQEKEVAKKQRVQQSYERFVNRAKRSRK